MDYNAQYQAYLNTAETALAQQADRCFNERSRVCEAARYSLFGGGKRVRAVLGEPRRNAGADVPNIGDGLVVPHGFAK